MGGGITMITGEPLDLFLMEYVGEVGASLNGLLAKHKPGFRCIIEVIRE